MGNNENVLFAPFGGNDPDPDAFLSTVSDGWAQQQRAKDFAPATIRTRRNVVMNLLDFAGRYPWEWALGGRCHCGFQRSDRWSRQVG